jgi:hypothetical protein
MMAAVLAVSALLGCLAIPTAAQEKKTDLMRQKMVRETGGRENQVLYWSRPADANNQTLTPRIIPSDKGRVSLKSF